MRRLGLWLFILWYKLMQHKDNEEVNLLLGVTIYVKFYASHCKKIKRLIG